jgi:hypothetical protein
MKIAITLKTIMRIDILYLAFLQNSLPRLAQSAMTGGTPEGDE